MSVTLKDVGSGFKRTAINQNFTDIESEINNNLLNKDGSTALESDLDFNSNRAINLADGVLGTDGVNVNQLNAIVSGAGGLSSIAQARETQLGSQAVANVFTLAGITYAVGTNTLSVYRNGQRLEKTIDYTETTTSSVTLTFTPNGTDRFVFITNDLSTSEVTTTAAITHTEDGTDYNLATYLSNREANTVAELKTFSPEVGERIVTKGYYTAGDGGHATYLVSAPQAVDGYGDHLLANGNTALLQEAIPDVRQYGAVADGNTTKTDNTLSIQAFIDAVGNGVGRFGTGRYGVTSISFDSDAAGGTYYFDNAGLVGIASTATDAIVELTGNDITFIGMLFINGDYNTNYDAGLKWHSIAGKTPAQFIKMDGLKIQNIQTGLLFGQLNGDTVIDGAQSENYINEYFTLGVEKAIYCNQSNGILYINGGAFGTSRGNWEGVKPGVFDFTRGRIAEIYQGSINCSNCEAISTESSLAKGFAMTGGSMIWSGGNWEIAGTNMELGTVDVTVAGLNFAQFTASTLPFIELIDATSGRLRMSDVRISANNRADTFVQTNDTPDWQADFVNVVIDKVNRLNVIKSSGANNTWSTRIGFTNFRINDETFGDYVLNFASNNMVDMVPSNTAADLKSIWWQDGAGTISADTGDVPIIAGRSYPFSLEIDGTATDGALLTIDRTSNATVETTGIRVQASELYLLEGWFKVTGAGNGQFRVIEYTGAFAPAGGVAIDSVDGLMDGTWKHLKCLYKVGNSAEYIGVGGRGNNAVCNFVDLKMKRVS